VSGIGLSSSAGFDVSDLVDRELEFERLGDEIRIRPKKLKISTVKSQIDQNSNIWRELL